MQNMINDLIANKIVFGIEKLYGQKVDKRYAQVQKTKSEFKGNYTIVVFPFLRFSHKSPEQTAVDLGKFLKNEIKEIREYNVIKGFLNLTISNNYWISFLKKNIQNKNFGKKENINDAPFIIEYSSPNTNKPLHLGHVRNNLIGWSVASILKASGKNVYTVNLVNDRGIHICKSMLAWQKWGKGITPEKARKKGDSLVGDFYILFDKEYKKEIETLIASGVEKEKAIQQAPLMIEAKKMLKKWEDGNPEIRKLWAEMNNWVYKGFDDTYKQLGITFDKIYYESDTYLLGKKLVEEGLEKGVFYKKDDGSVWVDLTLNGLDEKLLLRSDGTSVYITQDMGTAQLRYNDFSPKKLIYVVGNEQIYHFDVLKLVLKKLNRHWADDIYHLSYGMVELPNGKMKSREGTIVDADDLMNEMINIAQKISKELGKFDDFSKNEARQLYEMIGIGALKYFILKIDPKKTMLFNPAESIDFNGNTGPFIQYTHARIKSVLRKAKKQNIVADINKLSNIDLNDSEILLLQLLHEFPQVVTIAAETLNPAQIANYSFELAKTFNRFYHDYSILSEPNLIKRNLRLMIANFTGNVIKTAMNLLGIKMPERM